MTPTPRKSGIRLPWSRDEDLEESGAPVTSSEPPTETTAVTPAPTADEALETAASAASAATPSAEPSNGARAGDGNDLLVSLVAAMREVADHERETSLAGLRGSVESAIETLRVRAAAGADDLRQRAETDIAGIGDWVKVETERIVAEGDRKIESRRQQLTQQLTDHEQRSQHEIESLHDRVGEYERELGSFFAQLHEIDDPAAFGAAAKRMPRPPALAAQAGFAATPAAAPATAPEPSPVDTPAAAATPEGPPATAADQEAAMVADHRTRLDALGLTREESAAVTLEGPDAAAERAAGESA